MHTYLTPQEQSIRHSEQHNYRLRQEVRRLVRQGMSHQEAYAQVMRQARDKATELRKSK